MLKKSSGQRRERRNCRKQFSAAVAALQELGTLSGLRVERREVGRPGEFELLSADLRH
jgi:hypothetical protein